MYEIRQFKDTDIDFVMTYSFILGLEIKDHTDNEEGNAFTVVDAENEIVGVGIVGYHSGWYCEMPDTVHKLFRILYHARGRSKFANAYRGGKSCLSAITKRKPS
ncbi:hypothetical protein [Cellulosilyticum ruminicola]|uniref:hypothetical protein n=1 Tax=Cellulosilyticum ruminicola TaxID=425254 RepID=UPI0006D12F9B|nr:hypothetical protein [Cellulosilyticum ruminicola]